MITSHEGYSDGKDYTNRFRRTDVITVKEGSHIEVDFTFFDVEFGAKNCPDHLTVTDGNGAVLIKRLCGRVEGPAGYNTSEGNGNFSGSVNGNVSVNGNISANGNVSEISLENILDKTIASHTNVLIFTFVTDDRGTRRGWSANWKSVTPGLHFIFWHSSIICPGCPKNPPYPGDLCYPTDADCEYSISKDCNNCDCDNGPSSVSVCGKEKDKEKITFSCSSASGLPGIWKPEHESSLCGSSSGEQCYISFTPLNLIFLIYGTEGDIL